jgi:hypothetical protein
MTNRRKQRKRLTPVTLRDTAAAWCAARAGDLRLPGLAASLFVDRIATLRPAAAQPALNLMAFPKPALVEDLLSSLEGTPNAALLGASRDVMKGIARAFLPDRLGDNFYVTDEPDLVAAKAAYRDFLRRLWPLARRRAGIDLVVSSNFTYWAERELHGVCEETGTPFVVLHKESLKSPGRVDFFGWVYRNRRGPFAGRRLLVYNEIERQLQIDCAVAPAERITITGMPRLDRMHAWRRQNANRPRPPGPPTVLFFYFNAGTGLPFTPIFADTFYGDGAHELDPALQRLSWAELAEATAAAIVRLARDNPGMRVIVKGKPDHAKPGQMAGPLLAPDLPDNLAIVSQGDPFALICQADAVCGFNSTALLESLAAGKPVVVPDFGEAREARMRPYLVDLGGAAETAESPESLAAALARIAAAPPPVPAELDPAVAQALDTWTGNADGRAGARVAAALMAEIQASGSRRAA